jgi:hypothetical protein
MGLGNWHALRLGSSGDEVLKNLGEPKKRIAANDWRYETIRECELPEYFDVFFKDNTLVKVVFSAPAGDRLMIGEKIASSPTIPLGGLNLEFVWGSPHLEKDAPPCASAR